MSPAAAAVHDTILRNNRERASTLSEVSRALESWMHRQVARSALQPSDRDLLELGAGTLNHVAYEPRSICYDIVEPFTALYADKMDRDRVRAVFTDISEINGTKRYDRIVSIATLEHLTHLPQALARSGTLLRDGGRLHAAIPSEGGFLWGLSWRLSFALIYKLKTGRDWAEHMRYEHINDAVEIIQLIRYFFADVRVRRFPLPFHHLSLYAAIEARAPHLDRCQTYLDSAT